MMVLNLFVGGLGMGEIFPREADSKKRLFNGCSLNGMGTEEVNTVLAGTLLNVYTDALSLMAVTSPERAMYFQMAERLAKRMLYVDCLGKPVASNQEKSLAAGRLLNSSTMPKQFCSIASLS